MQEPNTPEKTPTKSRRAKGQTQTSISISEGILRRAREAAELQRRSFSQWIEILLDLHFQQIDRAPEVPALSLNIAAEEPRQNPAPLGKMEPGTKYPAGRTSTRKPSASRNILPLKKENTA